MNRMLLATALVLLALPVAAREFRAINQMIVTPRPDGTFEVSGHAELWANDYWCAAGDYARRVLDLPVVARIAVSEPYSKGSRTVSFGPAPNAVPALGVIIMGQSIRAAGVSLSVGQAHGSCANWILRRR